MPGGERYAPAVRRGVATLCLLLPALSLAASPRKVTEPPEPWVAPGEAALPPGTRSALILRGDEPIRAHPDAAAPRRGSGALGARLPVFGARRGPGCEDPWLLVGPEAWVCARHVELTDLPALGAGESPAVPPDGLPHRYFFVGPQGSLAYSRLASAEEVDPVFELQPGFAVALLRTSTKPGTREAYGMTTHGLWLPMRDLGAVRPPVFRGVTSPERLSFGWVRRDTVLLRASPGGPELRDELRVRHERVEVLSTAERRGKLWVEVAPSRWVAADDLRRPRAAPLPEGLLPHERWIDVDREQQVLVAYEGDVPAFATLVSTGKGPRGSDRITPPGEFRVWVKLRTSDMDNLESEAPHLYAIQAVPWVMYFHKGYGLHGTFWHRSFGEPRSHGCVNLVPLDAEWLFRWASPRLPAGWTAVLPTEHDRGTLVRVR